MEDKECEKEMGNKREEQKSKKVQMQWVPTVLEAVPVSTREATRNPPLMPERSTEFRRLWLRFYLRPSLSSP